MRKGFIKDTVINELKETYYIFNHEVVKKQWRQSQELVGADG
jgi:hypothetical protein